MKGIIKIEEASMLVLAIIAFSQMELSWWWFVGLFLTPDIGMFGYVFNSKVGAWSYNFFHLRGLAILLYLVGLWMDQWYVALGGLFCLVISRLIECWAMDLSFKMPLQILIWEPLGRKKIDKWKYCCW